MILGLGHHCLKKRCFWGKMKGTTLKEMALLKMLLQKKTNATPKHIRTLLCILRHKNTYLSIEDIKKNTLIENKELEKIMQSFSKNKFVEKEGCLYKKINGEKIAEII